MSLEIRQGRQVFIAFHKLQLFITLHEPAYSYYAHYGVSVSLSI